MNAQIPPYTCGGCTTRWSGVGRCHCGACHRTFAGFVLFDKHRRGGRCVDPETILRNGERVMHLSDGTWSRVEKPVQRVPPKRAS